MRTRQTFRSIALVIATALILPYSPAARADEDMPSNLVSIIRFEPSHWAYVTGDDEKFRAHRWMTEHYSGGLRDSEWYHKLNETTTLEATGHAIAGNEDYQADVLLENEERGYLRFEFEQFRKYYDGSGGVYYPFTGLSSVDLDRELYLDIGSFRAEAHAILDGLPDVTVAYEYDYKDGTKSRLTWTGVREGTTTKNIGPSWQDVNEKVHTVALKLDETYAGFDWHAEQEWEWMQADYLREERSISANATASERKARQQEQRPESFKNQTFLQTERWFWDDKAFISNGYRFSETDSREFENIFETNEFGVPTNFANPKQIRGAEATNQFVSNTWVGSLMLLPVEDVNVMGRMKYTDVRRDSSSSYPADNAGGAPNGTIDQNDVSENDSKIRSLGHSASLRYSGIPSTALYTDWEYDQTRNWLSEDRKSSSAGEIFSRESIAHLYRGTLTAGANFSPCRFFNATFQGRRREDNINYNNIRYTDPSGSTARSVFIDGQNVITDEISTRILLRPAQWIEPSFRYQLQHRLYETWGIPDDQNIQESIVDSHIYTWDMTLYPWERLLSTLSFSMQNAKVVTPASNNTSTSQSPTFNANVYTWLASTDYTVNEAWQINTYAQYSRAANFNDFVNDGGLPLGVEYRQIVAGAGATWHPREGVTVAPKYELDYYEPNDHSEVGQYVAHVVWFEVGIQWS